MARVTATAQVMFIALVNLLTIVILSRGKCGLSRCVSRYLLFMAVTDLLVIIIDLILRQIPIVYREQFLFVQSISVCNIHTVLLFTVTDCSVWFSVTFTFDRFVAICSRKLKTKYCTEKTAAVVLGTVTALSCLKDITWYFMLIGLYQLDNMPCFCAVKLIVSLSQAWGAIELLHYILTPGVPFVLILLLNTLTVRHILVANIIRRRLRGHSSGENPKDPEMESRRKSIILLFVISGNFILLWALFMFNIICFRMRILGYRDVYPPRVVQEIGFMLQLLSCCTNTCIYAVTQTKFREQFKNMWGTFSSFVQSPVNNGGPECYCCVYCIHHLSSINTSMQVHIFTCRESKCELLLSPFVGIP
ncbi:probable G-protein coupled receptor 139 [Heterodontus francisci]|uniref:probable G-protein coupled receptor 139 n=1 Tax=Heterodontus francisci TaxID=7792 RepID=UPI00355B82ED